MTHLPKEEKLKMPHPDEVDDIVSHMRYTREQYDGTDEEFALAVMARFLGEGSEPESGTDEPIDRSECLDVDGRPIQVGQIVENASDIKGYWNIAVVVKTEPAPAPDKYPGIRIYANDGKGGWVDPREARVIDSITPEQHEVIAERLEGESPRLRRMVWDLYQNPHSDRPTDANGEVLEVGGVVAGPFDAGIVQKVSEKLQAVKVVPGSQHWVEAESTEKLQRLTSTDYTPLARRTLPDDMTDKERLSMLAMGVIGEMGELYASPHESPPLDEIGDVAWYAHLLEDECDRQSIGHDDKKPMAVLGATAAVVEGMKKAIFHAVDRPALRVLAVHTLDYIDRKCDDLGKARLANIQKLYNRYPEGFETGGGNRE